MNFKTSSSKIILILGVLCLWEITSTAGRRSRVGREDEDDDSSASSSTETSPGPIRIRINENFPERPKRYDGVTINDPVSSSQNISPSIAGISQGYNNPYLLGGQQGLLNNPSLYQNSGLGFGLQNPYLGGGLGGINPYTSSLQSQYLLAQQGGQGGLGGLYNQDIYSQQGAGGLYNPFLGLNNIGLGGLGGGLGGLGGGLGGLGGGLGGLGGGLGGLGGGLGGGIGQGINPYLLGRSGYLGQNYLAQSLLSPYTSYNQLNPYNTFPFSSRFGVGRASNRINSQSSSSNSNNNDE